VKFDGSPVPATLVQITNITHKDGTPLEAENRRLKNIGIVTLCWIAGGFNCLTPFFKSKIILKNNTVLSVDLYWSGNASTGSKLPIETEPGVFEFETNTSIYQFRILTAEEDALVRTAIKEAIVANIIQQPENRPPAS